MNILITGVSGFLGSNLVDYFKSDSSIKLYGHSRNRLKTQAIYKNNEIELIEECSIEFLNEAEIDCVVHLAGIAHDLGGNYNDEDYEEVNFRQTCQLFDKFVVSKTKKFIYVSSIKAAIDTADYPVDENVTPSPSTPYGKSKLKAEEYIKSKILQEGKQYFLLRPCMVHGPKNKGNLNLLYKYVKSGLPYPFGGFHNQRSFLSIENFNFVIRNIITQKIPSGIYHLADTGYQSTTELVQLIASTLGKKVSIWNIPVGTVRAIFSLYKKQLLVKLTESMMVSNEKIETAMQMRLPVSMEEGLRKTVLSFHD